MGAAILPCVAALCATFYAPTGVRADAPRAELQADTAGVYSYAEFDAAVEKAAGQKATFTVGNVESTGVYELSLKFSDDTEIAATNSGLTNDKYPTLKSFNPNVGVYTDADGYSSCVYSVYLEEGDNTLSLHMQSEAKIEGVRTKHVADVDSAAFTSTSGVSTVVANMFYAIRLVQAQQDPIQTAPAELVIEEDGWYDLSYFGAAANQGEIYFKLTDEIGQEINMCSINLTWTQDEHIFNGIAYGTSSDIRCLYTNNSYVIDEEHPKDTLDNPYVRLFAGKYKVVAYAKKFRPVGDNTQVYYGGAAFATKVDIHEACEHEYEIVDVDDATCDHAEATTYECEKCGDTYTKKTSDALGHDYQAVGDVAIDGSKYLECTRKSDCGAVGFYAPDCGDGVAVANDNTTSTFGVTVADSGIYKAYFEFDGLDDETHHAGLRNTAYPHVTSFGDMYANTDMAGYDSFGYYVYLDAGANTLDLYLKADATVKNVRIEKVKAVDTLAVATSAGSNNYDSGYILSHLLVQGNRNPATIETELTVIKSGAYDLSYFAGSTNNGDFSITLEKDGKTIVLRSKALAAETSGLVSGGVTMNSSCAMFSENMYVYDVARDVVTSARAVDLEAGTYRVTIRGDEPNGYRQVWFGGGLFATETDAACAHSFEKVAEKIATCDEDGFEHYRCTDCGYYYEQTITAAHSYADTENSGSITCTECGMTEIVFATELTAVTESVGKKVDFDISVAADGIYRIWLDYDYSYTGTSTNQRTIALINKTITPDGYFAAAHSNTPVDDVIQSWNYASDDSSLGYGYKTGEVGGYNANYFDMYLRTGSNTLRLLMPATYDVTVRGAGVKLVQEIDTFTTFKHIAKHWTGSYMNGGDVLPLRLNVIQGSGQEQRNLTSTVNIATAGYYDLSYFAATPHGGHEISVTLSNGLQTISMTSQNISSTYASAMAANANNGRMLYSNNLYANGKHLVYLTAGEWDITVADTVVDNNRMLLFGGAVFFTLDGDCNHTFVDGDRTEPTCDEKGLVKHVCTKCGAVTAEEIAAVGHHSYRDEANTGKLTCSVCGITEVVFATAPQTVKNAGVAFNSLNINVDKAGVYEIYLDYTYTKQTEASKQDVGALINKTLYPDYLQSSHQMSNMVGFVQSFNHLTNDSSLALGYNTAADTGYNPNYFNAYLQAGNNELVLHSNYSTNAGYEVTVHGAKLVLVRETEICIATDHDGRAHTSVWFGSNLGFNVNLISNSNNSVRREGVATVELTGGTYDLSYLASAYSGHTDNELKITLTKGDTEIVMTSNKIYADEKTQCNNGGKMLLSDNLYTSGGEHLVELEAGTWTISVYCTNLTAYRGLMFGGLFITEVAQ